MAFYYSWKLTLVICATIPVAVLLLSWLSRGLGPAIEAQKIELAKASKYANTAITAVNTVKAFKGEEHELWQYYSTVKNMATKYLVQARANAIQFGITKFLMIVLFVQGFWYGLVLIRQGLNPGYVLTTFYACLYAMQATEIILPQWLVLKKGMSAGHTLQNIMNEGQKINRPTGPDDTIKPEFRGGDIEINDVIIDLPHHILMVWSNCYRSPSHTLPIALKKCSKKHLSSSQRVKQPLLSAKVDQAKARLEIFL